MGGLNDLKIKNNKYISTGVDPYIVLKNINIYPIISFRDLGCLIFVIFSLFLMGNVLYKKTEYPTMLIVIVCLMLTIDYLIVYYNDLLSGSSGSFFSAIKLLIIHNLVIVLGYTFLMIYAINVSNKIIRFICFLMGTVLILCIAIDHACLSVLNSRLDVHQATLFLSGITDSARVVLVFFKRNIAILWIWIILLHLRICCIKVDRREKSSVAIFVSCTFFGLSLILSALNSKNVSIFDYKFYNFIRVNMTLDWLRFSDEYNSCINSPKKKAMKNASFNGSSGKNAIVLVVESLSSYRSNLFGECGFNDTPLLDDIARNNIAFKNHYSNGYSTNTGVFSIISGKPFLHSNRKIYDTQFFGNALPKVFKQNGYSTYLFYSATDIAGISKIYNNSFFDRQFGDQEPCYNDLERTIFNAVPDEFLLAHAFSIMENDIIKGNKFFSFIMTTTSHGPYIVPRTRKLSYEGTLHYVDSCIYDFVKKLEKIRYFDNGILIITGDHRAMLPYTNIEFNKYGTKGISRVPLIIIDKSMSPRTYTNLTVHSSISPTIQYLCLGRADVFDYQKIMTLGEDDILVYQKLSPRDEVFIVDDKSNEEIYILKGDDSHFRGDYKNDYIKNLIDYFRI